MPDLNVDGVLIRPRVRFPHVPLAEDDAIHRLLGAVSVGICADVRFFQIADHLPDPANDAKQVPCRTWLHILAVQFSRGADKQLQGETATMIANICCDLVSTTPYARYLASEDVVFCSVRLSPPASRGHSHQA